MYSLVQMTALLLQGLEYWTASDSETGVSASEVFETEGRGKYWITAHFEHFVFGS